MNPLLLASRVLLVVPLVLVPGLAQGGVVDVVPGRDYREAKLLSPGLTDVWKLEVHVDEMLWCVVESAAFDPVLELVDAQGKLVASHDGAGTRSELWRRATTTGAGAFRVRAFENRGGGHYTFLLHRFRTQPLGVADEATHTFGKEQWWHYRVALQAGGVLVPTVLGDGRLTAVLDADRNALASLHGGYRAARDGDHFVRVEGAEGKHCQVLTQLARIGDRSLQECSSERIAPYGLDTWRWRVPAGQCLDVDLRMPELALQFDLHEADPSDRGPGFVATGHFDKGGMVRRLFFVRRDSTLELRLRHAGASSAPYEVAVRTWGQTVGVGERIDGQLPLGDGALFHLDAAAGELLDIAVASTVFDAAIDVLDPDGNLIAQADDRSLVDRNPQHRFLVTRPGRYHVLVYAWGGRASGAFTLQTASQPLPLLTVGGVLAVQPGAHVHLDLQTGDVVWLSLRSATSDGALQVIDPAGDGGFVAEGGGLGGDVLVAYRASHAGRHTLLVHARSGRGDGELRVVQP